MSLLRTLDVVEAATSLAARGASSEASLLAEESAPFVMVRGFPSTGKTEVLVRRAVVLIRQGVPLADMRFVAASQVATDDFAWRLAQAIAQERLKEAREHPDGNRTAEAVDGREAYTMTRTVRGFIREQVRASFVGVAADAAFDADDRVEASAPRELTDAEFRIVLQDLKLKGVSLPLLGRALQKQADGDNGPRLTQEEQLSLKTLIDRLDVLGAYAPGQALTTADRLIGKHLAQACRCRSIPYLLIDDAHLLSFDEWTYVSAFAKTQLFATEVADSFSEKRLDVEKHVGQDAVGSSRASRSPLSAKPRIVQLKSIVGTPSAIAFMARDLERANLESIKEPQLNDAAIERETDPMRHAYRVLWESPAEEARAIVSFARSVLENAQVALGDVFIASSNAAWLKRLLKALTTEGIASEGLFRQQAYLGDPRSSDRSEGLAAFVACHVAADERDIASWRTWCALGCEHARADQWLAFEEWAEKEGFSLVQGIEHIREGKALPQDCPFNQVAERIVCLSEKLPRISSKRGFDLARELCKKPDSKACEALFRRMEGDEDAVSLASKMEGCAYESTFRAKKDRVRIGSFAALESLHPKVLVIGGLNEQVEDAGSEDRAARDLAQALIRTSDRLVLSSVRTAPLDIVESERYRVYRSLDRTDKEQPEVFTLKPAQLLDCLGRYAPSEISGQEFLRFL